MIDQKRENLLNLALAATEVERRRADLRITLKRFLCWQEPTSVSLILDRLCRENMR